MSVQPVDQLVDQDPEQVTGRPLSAAIETTRDAVHDILDRPEADALTRHKGVARLSGHLAVMCRTVYPRAGHWPGIGVQLKEACLGRAREVQWTMRALECHLSGCTSAAGRPVLAISAALGRQVGEYWAHERELVDWLEGQLDEAGQEQLAGAYWRALRSAPTRPHPRCPRSGPLRYVAFWAHGQWDRLLDGVDSRAGVGRDFAAVLAQPLVQPLVQPAATGEQG